MPEYRGASTDGKSFTDERVTVVLMDRARMFWPLILKLSRDDAGAFAARLKPAQ